MYSYSHAKAWSREQTANGEKRIGEHEWSKWNKKRTIYYILMYLTMCSRVFVFLCVRHGVKLNTSRRVAEIILITPILMFYSSSPSVYVFVLHIQSANLWLPRIITICLIIRIYYVKAKKREEKMSSRNATASFWMVITILYKWIYACIGTLHTYMLTKQSFTDFGQLDFPWLIFSRQTLANNKIIIVIIIFEYLIMRYGI